MLNLNVFPERYAPPLYVAYLLDLNEFASLKIFNTMIVHCFLYDCNEFN